ncbi:AMP-binding protein [Streptomyces sp. NPDC003247]|uniref:non-ribosomal peptide synthetase n=1 Tax=Streptomyces sp. NPDC003247 TaxID=3364677 RepID=UPI0036B278DA
MTVPDRTTQGRPSGAPEPDEEVVVPASAFQQRIWLAERMDAAATYNVPLAWRVTGPPLDADTLRRALALLVARFEILRTRFEERDGTLRQRIGGPWSPRVDRVDLRGDGAPQDALHAWLGRAADEPFDPASGRLLTAALLETGGPDGQVLFVRLHHLVWDGESAQIFLRELADCYAQASGGGPKPGHRPLPAVAGPRGGHAQYRDFVAAQDGGDTGQRAAELAYWTDHLAGAPAHLDLSPSGPDPEGNGTVTVPLPAGLAARLRRVQQDQVCTLYQLAATALAAVLHRWTGRDDVVFGAPLAQRDDPRFAGLIGPCLNTVVLRSRPAADATLRDLLVSLRGEVLDAYQHSGVPFEKVVERLNPPRRSGRIPYADVTLSLETVPAEPPRLGGSTLVRLPLSSQDADYRAKFGLTVVLTLSGDTFEAAFSYRGDHAHRADVAQLAALYGRLLARLPETLGSRLDTLDLVADDAAELARLDAWENGGEAGPATTVPELLGRWVRRTPDAPAVDTARGVLTYAGLHRRALALAARLRPLCPADDPVVAVLLRRGEDLVVAMLAAWYAGAAFCPLDPDVPAARVGELLDDLGACAVIADGPSGAAHPAAAGLPVLDVPGAVDGRAVLDVPGAVDGRAVLDVPGAVDGRAVPDVPGAVDGCPVLDVPGAVDGRAVPDVPGVVDGCPVLDVPGAVDGRAVPDVVPGAVQGRAVPDVVSDAVDGRPVQDVVSDAVGGRPGQDRPATGPDAVGPHLASPQAAAYIVYTSGTTGRPKGVVVRHRGLAQLASWGRESFGLGPGDRTGQLLGVAFDATQWDVWSALASGGCVVPHEGAPAADDLADWLTRRRISVVLLATPLAEALWASGAALPRLRQLLVGAAALTRTPPAGTPYRIRNAYGPTESTVIALTHDLSGGATGPVNTIGRPIAGTRAEILDPAGQRCPAGVPGEIFLQGAGVAAGYWRRPELTAERFHGRAGPVYRTGDRGRWLLDGTVEYLGRADRQLKIRGHRIEPGEIEAALLRHPAVSSALVHGDPGRTPGLVAYLVAASPAAQRPDRTELLDDLRSRLPAPSVPEAYVWLDRLPLNASGKVDTARLPRPRREDLPVAAERTAPRDDTERRITAAWADVLGRDEIGVHDNFFDLGGNSLLLTRLHTSLTGRGFTALTLTALYEHTTVAALARFLTASEAQPAAPADGLRDRAARARRAMANRGPRGRAGVRGSDG